MINEGSYICQVCGMEILIDAWSYLSSNDTTWLHDGLWLESNGWQKEGPMDPLDTGEDFTKIVQRLRWFSDACILYDPDDEVGQLIPELEVGNIYPPLRCSPESYGYDSDFDPFETVKMRQSCQASNIEVWRDGMVEGPKLFRHVPYLDDITMQHASADGMYVVVHADCLEVAKKVFASSLFAHMRDMRGLFTALRWREGIAYTCGDRDGNQYDIRLPPLPRVNYMLGQHQYYVPRRRWAFRECRDMEWPGPYPSARANLLHSLGKSPLEIEDLTNCLLKNLRPCRSRVTFTPESSKLAENLARMPVEILDIIFAMMGRDLPRVSSRLVSQKFWKEQLKAGQKGLLPWLWDIDAALIDEKDAERCPTEFEWDWELLVRQLSRGVDYGERPNDPKYKVCTGYHTDLAHVPAGLHNRRRIWQLLEEMFVGDAIPWPYTIYYENSLDEPYGPVGRRTHVQKECLPLWWNKSGDLLSSPIWIPSIDFVWVPDGNHWRDYYVFRRRIGGEVYEFGDNLPLQYWQKHADESGHDESTASEMKQGATVKEIYEVLRPLGYPV